MESIFYLGIFCECLDVNVVLYFQLEYVMVVFCMKNKLFNFNVIVEIFCYVGKEIFIIFYYCFGFLVFVKVVVEVMKEYNFVLLINYGQVVCGKDFDQVYECVIFFEMVCCIIV